jgi:hypothetical protein
MCVGDGIVEYEGESMTVRRTVNSGQTQRRQGKNLGISAGSPLALNKRAETGPHVVCESEVRNPCDGARQRTHRSSLEVKRKREETGESPSVSILSPDSAVVLAAGGDRQIVSKAELGVRTDHAEAPTSRVRGVLQRDVGDSPTTRQMNGSTPVRGSASTFGG